MCDSDSNRTIRTDIFRNILHVIDYWKRIRIPIMMDCDLCSVEANEKLNYRTIQENLNFHLNNIRLKVLLTLYGSEVHKLKKKKIN